MSRKGAFTLVEILIVLTILSVLAAILFPVFAAARERSTQGVCVSNLKQIGALMQIYVSDYDSTYPPSVSGTIYADHSEGTNWRELIAGVSTHKDRWFWCGDASAVGKLSFIASSPDGSGYAYNDRLSTEHRVSANTLVLTGQSEPVVRSPALMVVVCEARTSITSLVLPDYVPRIQSVSGMYDPQFTAEINAQIPGAIRHQGGANYVFADGHVKWLVPGAFAGRYDGTHPSFGL